MRSPLAIAGGIVAAGSLLAGPLCAPATAATSCTDFQIILARGTGEQGSGSVGPAASGVISTIGSRVATFDLPYPATSDFTNSSSAGVSALANQLSKQSAACPGQRFVLMGYSQGAWVVGDALAGSGNGAPAPVSRAVGSKISAIVLYGDPRFVAGEPFAAGTSKPGVSGVYPRAKGALSAYASRIRSYCYADDTICQNGASGDGHSRYWQAATADAAAFALAKLSKPNVAGQPAPTSVPAPAAPATQAPPAPATSAAAAGAPAAAVPAPAVTATPAPAPSTNLWGRVLTWFRPFR